jgi:glycosyltransferase involved in cell wall biosynthesis
MKKIKILYTIPNFHTAGSGIALMKLITNLDKTKFEPHIVCVHKKGKYFAEVVAQSGIPVHIFPYTGEIRPYRKALIRILKFALFIRKEKFDIVFSYHYSADYVEAIAARLAGAKFFYVKKNMSWFGPSYRAWRLKSFFANKIFVQNKDMINIFFNNTNKAELVSIGVDTEEFYPQPADRSLKEELGINSDEKIVLCVANIAPKKGIDVLIKAFEKVIQKDIKSRLLIVGDDRDAKELVDDLKKMIIEKNLSEKIIFTGKRFDIKRFYSIADVFVLASTGNEGAPISIQEAMASGVVVITTNTPGNRDQLAALPGQLAEPNDFDELADKIFKYLNLSDSEKKDIIDKQLEIINESYSLIAEVKKHETIYLSI